MNIFRLFKSFYAPKRTKLHHSKTFSLGKMPPNPSDKRLARPPKKLALLGKSCIRPWTLTKKFISGDALVKFTLADS